MKMIICAFSLLMAISCSPSQMDTEPKITRPSVTCKDGIQNGDETGIDCGGSFCPSCPEIIPNIPTSGYNAPKTYENYTLVWSDEFNEETLNTNKWGFHLASGCPYLCGWGNNELQYYTNKNHFFKDGNLIITAKNEKESGFDYTSARIQTDNKFEFKYGRVDIRASMPSATGTWVAFWLLNKNYSVQNPAATWPSGGEIDIMEYLGQDKSKILGTPHYGSDLTNHKYNSTYYTTPNGDFDKVYYVFSIVWEQDKISWLVNNVVYKTFTPNDTNGQPYPFNDVFYLLISLSVGGNLPIAPIASEYPATLIIDYIRVFQEN